MTIGLGSKLLEILDMGYTVTPVSNDYMTRCAFVIRKNGILLYTSKNLYEYEEALEEGIDYCYQIENGSIIINNPVTTDDLFITAVSNILYKLKNKEHYNTHDLYKQGFYAAITIMAEEIETFTKNKK